MAGIYVRISQRPQWESQIVETIDAHCSNSGDVEVASAPISEFQDVLEVRLNRKIII